MKTGTVIIFSFVSLILLGVIALLFTKQRSAAKEQRLDIRANKSEAKQDRKDCRLICSSYGIFRLRERNACLHDCMASNND